MSRGGWSRRGMLGIRLVDVEGEDTSDRGTL